MIGEELSTVYEWQTKDQMIKVLATKVHHNHIREVYAEQHALLVEYMRHLLCLHDHLLQHQLCGVVITRRLFAHQFLSKHK